MYYIFQSELNLFTGKNPDEVNMYLHLRLELEKVLTQRIPENWNADPNRRNGEHWPSQLDYGLELLECMYREVYKDDPEYKPELIKHTDEELDIYLGI